MLKSWMPRSLAANDRLALSSFRKLSFTPIRNASKPTVGRSSCTSNDGFLIVGVAERSLRKILPKGDFPQRPVITAGLGLNHAHYSDLPPERQRTGEANHPKYKTNFPLSLLPKSVVVAVTCWLCIFRLICFLFCSELRFV